MQAFNDIDISSQLDWKRIRKLFVIGMAVTMLLEFIGNHPLANGLTTAWISIRNIWMFGGLVLMMEKAKCNQN